MTLHVLPPYHEVYNNIENLPAVFKIGDHLEGFTSSLGCRLFETLNQHAQQKNLQYTLIIDEPLPTVITDQYPLLNFDWRPEEFRHRVWHTLQDYHIHPAVNHNNFVCSFNGSAHVSRKLLVSALHKQGWYQQDFVSKNFSYSPDILDGHLADLLDQDQHRFYRKFFIGKDSDNFFPTVNSFEYRQFDHSGNIRNLESKLTQSFLHVVSESMATSYYPFITEKFLYSVVTRGLFLAYAQPAWHDHLTTCFGFKRYERIFDYGFDRIQNPIQRLIALFSMISKFSSLDSTEWQDLYDMEKDTIEYNYDHYFSQDYLKCLAKYSETVYTSNIIKGKQSWENHLT
jgi:hypothetical protein